ncbi:marvel domain-containing protein [Xylariaceae sp. FL1019]|nr:marvel domain-containing protein [Xylariaceae sp. FL1019]
MLNVAAIALRGFLLIFGAVVLGLSVTLAKQQVIGNPPSETSFNSFVGAFGILVSGLAVLNILIDRVPKVGVMAADALASVLYLAGAIALTIALKNVSSCTSNSNEARGERYANKLLNGGCRKTKDGPDCPNVGGSTQKDIGKYTGPRCQKVQADYVFGYLGFLLGAASVLMTFLAHRRGGATHASVV